MRLSFELDERLAAALLSLAGLWLMLYVGGDAQQAELMLVGVMAGRGLRPGGRD